MKKILVLIVLNIIIFFILQFVQYSIIQKQNFYNVENVKKCVAYLSPKTENQFISDINICAKNVRNLGQIGDMFVLEPKTKRIIWDASSDCKLPQSKSFLKPGFVCSLFYKPESCKEASNLISERNFGEGIWYFYKTPEYYLFGTYDLNSSKKYRIVSGGEFVDILNLFIPIYLFILFVDFLVFIFCKDDEDEK